MSIFKGRYKIYTSYYPSGDFAMRSIALAKNNAVKYPSCLSTFTQDNAKIFPHPEVRNILNYHSGQTILFEDDTIHYLYEIVTGTVKTYTILNDGRRQITGFYTKGDILGLPARGRYFYSAEAITDTTVCYHTLSRMEQLLQSNPDLAQKMIEIAYHQLSDTHAQLVSLGRKKPDERVATFLLNCQRWTTIQVPSQEAVVSLPMSRLDIADYLGLTQETVCRVFSKFNRAGLIKLLSASQFTLKDQKQLSTLAQTL
tara:strand:- start:271 stop:1038 length:768 start_codon:yes stop_codon:yes gene_type:complete